MHDIYLGRRDRAHLSFRRHPRFGWLIVQCLDAKGILRVERVLGFLEEDERTFYRLGETTIYAASFQDEARYSDTWATELILRLLSYERAARVDAQLP